MSNYLETLNASTDYAYAGIMQESWDEFIIQLNVPQNESE